MTLQWPTWAWTKVAAVETTENITVRSHRQTLWRGAKIRSMYKPYQWHKGHHLAKGIIHRSYQHRRTQTHHRISCSMLLEIRYWGNKVSNQIYLEDHKNQSCRKQPYKKQRTKDRKFLKPLAFVSKLSTVVLDMHQGGAYLKNLLRRNPVSRI